MPRWRDVLGNTLQTLILPNDVNSRASGCGVTGVATMMEEGKRLSRGAQPFVAVVISPYVCFTANHGR